VELPDPHIEQPTDAIVRISPTEEQVVKVVKAVEAGLPITDASLSMNEAPCSPG
jgi:hypothetical protein